MINMLSSLSSQFYEFILDYAAEMLKTYSIPLDRTNDYSESEEGEADIVWITAAFFAFVGVLTFYLSLFIVNIGEYMQS